MTKDIILRGTIFTLLLSLFLFSGCSSNDDEITPLTYVTIVENNPQTDGFDFPIYSGEMTGWKIPPNPSVTYDEGSFLVHRDDGIHPAIDFFREDGSSAEGYELWSIGDGVVVDIVYDREAYPSKWDGSDRDEGWGNLILIQHDYLENGVNNRIFALYAHTKTIEVELNDVVQRNQLIGLVGKTDGVSGTVTWPDHLHFEIRITNITADSWPKSSGLTTDAEVLEHWTHPLDFVSEHRP
ncbi:MAG: M23 family metallopeptidase [Gammaproteobacteria bacterium]|nr:M23 family metallopeptidase [Gammaproteobacteria bacterium]